MKRIIALLLVFMMVFSLCACGGKDKPETAAEPETTDSMASEETAAEAEEPQYDVVVEDCAVAWEGKGYIAIKPKVHNCTDMDAAFLLLNCELIGKDGRTIRVAGCDTGGVAAGSNEWVSGTMQIENEEIEELAELKFSGGKFDISVDGSCYRQTVTFAETSFTREYVFGE